MDQWKILVSKEIRHVHDLMRDQWGFEEKLDFAFLQNNQDNLYIITKEVANIDWKKLHITAAGSYFGEIKKGLRLSIEGSQLVGPKCSKNILDITKEEAMLWLKGHDLPTNSPLKGYLLVRSGRDFFGSTVIKDGLMMNFVPKNRRLPENA